MREGQNERKGEKKKKELTSYRSTRGKPALRFFHSHLKRCGGREEGAASHRFQLTASFVRRDQHT